MIRITLKQSFRSICIAIVAAMTLALAALAGTVVDQGRLSGEPAQVNYVAWIDYQRPPRQVLTEDGYNSAAGVNQGYFNREWFLSAPNFMNPGASHGDHLYVIFGGLVDDTGSIWTYDFTYDQYTPTTNHGTIGVEASGTCPVMAVSPLDGTSRTLTWDGPAGYYLIYRSLNESGADNGASNGRYDYLATVNSAGSLHTYVDNDPILGEWPSWYIVLPATAAGEITGCHSEEGTPTAVILMRFEALPENNRIHVQWETATELDNLGFNLYRGESATGPWAKLNTTIIPAQQPGLVTGAVYEWLDEAVPPDTTVFYRLEDVDIHGVSTFHGPVSAMPAGPAAIGLRSFAASSPMAPVVVLGCIILGAALPAGWSLQRRRRTS